MTRKRSKTKNKKQGDFPEWQLEVLRTGWIELSQNQNGSLPKSEFWKRHAFRHLQIKQLEAWKRLRECVDIDDYPYAKENLEPELYAKKKIEV